MHPDDRETVRQAHAANLAGQATTIEYRNRQKDGTWMWLEGHCTPIRDAAGRVAKLLLVSRDITERKRAETALRESEAQFRALFEHARIDAARDVETKRFLLANPQIQKRLGYAVDELLQLAVPDVDQAADRPRIIEDFERQSRGETTAASNLPVLCKDGTVFYADVSTARLTLGAQVPPGRVPRHH